MGLARVTPAIRGEIMADSLQLFIGTLNREAPYFQGARGKGLCVYDFDEDSLTATLRAESAEIENPTFLSVTADGSRVYANSEVFGWNEGLVSAFAYDRAAGSLRYINAQTTLGSITAQNTLLRDGSKLLLVNYGLGAAGPDRSMVVFGLRPDGGLTPPLASVAHEGTGPDPARQERAHAHSVTETACDGVVIVADLGTDQLVTYRVAADGGLTHLAAFAAAPGAGPRHLAVDPGGRFVFVMNELDSTVTSLAFDAQSGALTAVDVQPAVPEAARAHNHCADIQISPDGRFLYGSNRGHDSIAILEVDRQGGRLTPRGHVPCGGATPRNLALTPSGRHLLSANQNSDRVSIFARDAATGALQDTGRAIAIGTPMCLKFAAGG